MGGRKFWRESAWAGPGSISGRDSEVVNQYTNLDRWHPGISACTKSLSARMSPIHAPVVSITMRGFAPAARCFVVRRSKARVHFAKDPRLRFLTMTRPTGLLQDCRHGKMIGWSAAISFGAIDGCGMHTKVARTSDPINAWTRNGRRLET